MSKQEQLQWEQQTLGQALDILCDDTNSYDQIIIFGAEHLTPSMKKVLGIKKRRLENYQFSKSSYKIECL